MSAVPDLVPGQWNVLIIKGATWPGTTVSYNRDGVAVIPVSASVTIRSPEGTLLVTLVCTINGGTGEITIPAISAATTAAYTWTYGNILLRCTETGSVITDLLAGNATCTDRAD